MPIYNVSTVERGQVTKDSQVLVWTAEQLKTVKGLSHEGARVAVTTQVNCQLHAVIPATMRTLVSTRLFKGSVSHSECRR